MDVLFVCTGNICRSPMAEYLFRDLVGERHLGFGASSVGTSFEGAPPTREAIRVMADRGIDISAHRSRTLRLEIVERADLILGMEPQHVREVAILSPAAFGRSFTLKEFLRTTEARGPRGHEPLPAWVAGLSEGRDPADLLGSRPEDTVEDPYGRSRRVYRQCAAEITDLVGRLTEVLGGPRSRAETA